MPPPVFTLPPSFANFAPWTSFYDLNSAQIGQMYAMNGLQPPQPQPNMGYSKPPQMNRQRSSKSEIDSYRFVSSANFLSASERFSSWVEFQLTFFFMNSSQGRSSRRTLSSSSDGQNANNTMGSASSHQYGRSKNGAPNPPPLLGMAPPSASGGPPMGPQQQHPMLSSSNHLQQQPPTASQPPQPSAVAVSLPSSQPTQQSVPTSTSTQSSMVQNGRSSYNTTTSVPHNTTDSYHHHHHHHHSGSRGSYRGGGDSRYLYRNYDFLWGMLCAFSLGVKNKARCLRQQVLKLINGCVFFRPRSSLGNPRKGPRRDESDGGDSGTSSGPVSSSGRNIPSSRSSTGPSGLPSQTSTQTATGTGQQHQGRNFDLEASSFPPLPGSDSPASKADDSPYDNRFVS